jgi:cell division protein FtsX
MLVFNEVRPVLNSEQVEKDWLKSLLRSEIVDVTFIKKDGTERKLKCTLNENIVPAKVVDESANTVVRSVVRSVNNDAQAVYDVESKGWRSFRWDSVVAIEYGDLVK